MHLPSNVPGQRELELMCAKARGVAALCDIFAGRGFDDENQLLEQADRLSEAFLDLALNLRAEHDPDVHPYVWDEDE